MDESYVYTLAYPDGTVFYVGQGIKRRMFEHDSEARRGIQSLKCDAIREIWASGGEVVRTKVQENLGWYDALRFERNLIDKLKPVGNKLTHNRQKVSIHVPSVRNDLAKRFRRNASAVAGRKLSDVEITELAASIAYRAIEAYCDGIENTAKIAGI